MVAPLVKRIWIWCRNLLIFLFVSSILAVVVYKFVPVYYTPLMFIRMYEQHQDGKKMKLGHTWVPISKIAQPLVQAVIASEDNLFMEHNGFDVEQIQKARAEAEKGKRVRGASTISQQTAKNVFLWSGKSYLRKGLFYLLDRMDMGKGTYYGSLSELDRDGGGYLWCGGGSGGSFR